MKSKDISTEQIGTVPAVKDRLKCPGCNEPLTIIIDRDIPFNKIGHMETAKFPVKSWWYRSYGHFCTLRCAAEFANRMIDNQKTTS
jgi:hypothetical protein